jgi:hypothetical protein
MRYRRGRPDGGKPASDEPTMPPARPDGREGQDGRPDEKREGGRREDYEWWCSCNNDWRRR